MRAPFPGSSTPTPAWANAPQLLVAREEEAALLEAWDGLPDETHELLTLYYREGRSVRQVAELLELREEVVKKRLERARGALQDAVLERFESAVRKTAPGAAFTAAVIAAIAGMPGTARAAAAKQVAGGGALAKLSAALTSHALALGLVFALIAAFGGLASWLVVRPAPLPAAAMATMTPSGEAAKKPLGAYPRALHDRAKRDELRTKLLAAYAAATARASASQSSRWRERARRSSRRDGPT